MSAEEVFIPSLEILEAITELWQLRQVVSNNLERHPAFLRLVEACSDSGAESNKFGFNYALQSALSSLGAPPQLHKDVAHLSSSSNQAAKTLSDALAAAETIRLHLAPLDCADELPDLSFGSAKVRRFSEDELRELFDEEKVRRHSPHQTIDVARFAEFHWLVVEETVPLARGIQKRALPFLSYDMSRDFGEIEPHKGPFPKAIEDALFYLTLASWEQWSTMSEVDWRGFRVPWVHTVSKDIFVRPSVPPSPDTLSWEPHIYDDGYGGTVEVERPVKFRLDKDATAGLKLMEQSQWNIVSSAQRSILFDTPIAHFLVRAYMADGVDEFLAHITMIEAALGMQADYQRSFRVAPDRHRKMGVTKKMRGRVAGLLGNQQFADQYDHLFNLRSAYLHGRNMSVISTRDRVSARSLARQVVEAMISASQTAILSSRESFLDDLLDQGAPMIRP
tara:strand:- start:573 stop:1919 length:1347 start_codon:yes stop_codon:yes gene_type:complete